VRVSAVQGSEELVREQSVRELLQFSHGEVLLLEVGNSGTGIVREPSVSRGPLLEAVSRQQLVKTQKTKNTEYVL
jgi:hypothetical protein